MSDSRERRDADNKNDEGILTCGIVMPISPIDGCTADHWSDVKAIIAGAVNKIVEFKFKADLVSDGDDVGVIHKRIVTGVYSADIVVCDVSANNPNVMFELGMRLAFDKPTIIIKDDKTNFNFDISIVEHLIYPRDLRYQTIVSFQEKLAKKIVDTYKASQSDVNHSVFLKNFEILKATKISEKEVPEGDLILAAISELRGELISMRDVEFSRLSSERMALKKNVNNRALDVFKKVQYLILSGRPDTKETVARYMPTYWKIIDELPPDSELRERMLVLVSKYPSFFDEANLLRGLGEENFKTT